MPSPVGHFLGGMIGGLMIVGRRPASFSVFRRSCSVTQRSSLALFGLLGVAADVDFLFGAHSTYTHSVGAVVIVGLASAAVSRGVPGCALPSRRLARLSATLDFHRGLLGLACAVAYGSHILLDWLGTDTVAPIGIMALWPFGARHYLSGLHWFMAIHREYWTAATWTHNVWAVLRELLMLGPVGALAWLWARQWKQGGREPSSPELDS